MGRRACGASGIAAVQIARDARGQASHIWALLVLLSSLPSAWVFAQDTTGADARAKVLLQARAALADVELYVKIPADDDATGPSGAGETLVSQLQVRQHEQLAREKKAI